MRRFIQIVEAAQSPLLFHTSSASGAFAIMEQRAIKPGMQFEGAFISFSEIPLIGYRDIRGNDVSIGFHPYAFWGRIEQVNYTEDWFLENREKGAYIAGEGWKEQWIPPDDAYDDDGEEDEEIYERAYEDAEFEAFVVKADEREWITREPYESLVFQPQDVALLTVNSDVAEWQRELAQIGYQHVKVVQK